MKYLFAAIDARAGRAKQSTAKGALRAKYNPIQLKKLIVDASEGVDEKSSTHDFVDTLERIVNEIRNTTEHSTAFLTKVRKSDVPDYYDVIKKPMDLGTLLKRVKAQTYRTKKAFAEDLDQIWANALLYNSYPDHPIRRSAEFLRVKSNQLLEFISDPSLPARSILASAVNAEAKSKAGTPAGDDDDDGGESDEEDGHHPIGRGRLGSFLNGRARADSASPLPGTPAQLNGRGLSRHTRSPSPLLELSFDERPAIIRTPQAMADFDQLDRELAKLDRHLSWDLLRAPAASSSRLQPFDPPPPPPTTNGTAPPPPPAETAPPSALPPRLASLVRSLQPSTPAPATPISTPGSTPAPSAAPEPIVTPAEDEPPDSIWWTTVGTAAGAAVPADGAFAGALGAGLPAVPFVGTRAERAESRKGKGRAVAGAGEGKEAQLSGVKAKANGVLPNGQRRSGGLSGRMRDNWEAGQHLKRLHARLGRELATEGPLGPDSDDDDAEDLAPVSRADYSVRPIPRAVRDSAQAQAVNRDCMEAVSHRVLGHAGFDSASAMAIGVLAHVATDYMANLGRTLRLYSDRFGGKLGQAEVLLHALAENGVARPAELREYVEEDVVGRGNRLRSQAERLKNLRKTELDRAVQEAEEQMLVVDGEEWVMENEGEVMASGALGARLGQDFFGLYSTGLADDLAQDWLVVPSRLFRGEPNSSSSSDSTLPFPLPPAYVPLTPSALPAQIGLLQPYYALRHAAEDFGLADDDELVRQAAATAEVEGGPKPMGVGVGLGMAARAKVPVGTGRIPVKVKREDKGEGGASRKRRKKEGDSPERERGE